MQCINDCLNVSLKARSNTDETNRPYLPADRIDCGDLNGWGGVHFILECQLSLDPIDISACNITGMESRS